MKVISLLNEKGGVGKTTLSVHIAAGLANLGKRVLLIDADAQGHSTIMLGQSKRGGLYDLVVREASWRDCTVAVSPDVWAEPSWNGSDGALMVVPSNVETQGITNMVDDTAILKERLEEIEDVVDYVIIDTSPTPSLLHAMLYYATHGIIMPSQPEGLAMDGLAHTTRHMTRVNKLRRNAGLPTAKFLGVVPTMFDARTNAHEWGLNEIRKHFGETTTWPVMPMRTIWRDVSAKRVTIFSHAPRDVAADEMRAIVRRTMEAIHV